MTTVAILPEGPLRSSDGYRAVAGDIQSHGATPGQALDALASQLGGPQETTLVILQPMRPDAWFTAEQQRRLADLMARWRAARDAGQTLPSAEQSELEALVQAELQAALQRSASLAQRLSK